MVTEADEESNITQYKYTPEGKLLRVLDSENNDRNLSFTVSYTYDNLGNIKEKEDGENNTTVYKYDIIGRVKEVYDSTVLKSQYTYYIDIGKVGKVG